MTHKNQTETQRQNESREKVKQLYTERASFYDRFFINFLGWGRELEAFFRESDYLAPNMKVLDAGSGTGVVTKVLYKLALEKSCEKSSFCAFDLTEVEHFQGVDKGTRCSEHRGEASRRT